MTTIDLNTGDQLLLVPVPEKCNNFEISDIGNLFCFEDSKPIKKVDNIGDGIILGCFYPQERRIDFAERVKEEWVEEICEVVGQHHFMDYTGKYYATEGVFEKEPFTKEESFLSLLSSKVEGEGKYVVVLVKK